MIEILGFQWFFVAVLWVAHFSRLGVNLFHPGTLYLAFHTLVFVLRPTLVGYYDSRFVYEYMRFWPSHDVQVITFLVTDLAAAVFVIVCHFKTPRRLFSSGESLDDATLLRRSLLVAAVFVAPFALASMAYAITNPIVTSAFEGQMNAIRLTRDARSGANLFTDGSSAYFVFAQYMVAPVAIGWAFINRFKLLHCVPLGLYFLLRMTQGGGRFAFLLLLIAAVLSYLAQRRLRLPRFSTVLIILVGLLLFAAIGADRLLVKRIIFGTTIVEESTSKATTDVDPVYNTIVRGLDFANYEYLTFVVNFVPEASGTFTYFTQYADVVVKPIPRAIWPDKPPRSVFNLVSLNDYGNFWALTVSLVGDGWLSLGWVGVLITSAVVSYLCSRAYSGFVSTNSSIYTVFYCIFASLTPQWFRDGGISIVDTMAFHTLPLLVWHLVYRSMVRRKAARTTMSAPGYSR